MKPPLPTTDSWTSLIEGTEEHEVTQPETQPPIPSHEPEPEVVKESPAPKPSTDESVSPPKTEPTAPPTLVAPASSQHKTATPSPKLLGRTASAPHRSSAKYKTTDQPVVLPSSFGPGIEKVGMQFGSLSLGGENLLDISL